MKNKIAVIGSGSMGTALAKVLFDSGHKNLMIYGIDDIEVSELKKGMNTNYFVNSVKLPNFETTNDLKKAIQGAHYIVLVTPSKVIDKVYKEILTLIDSEVIIINGSKGFYPNSKFLIHEGLINESKNNKNVRGLVSIVGPSHAEELVLQQPTSVALVGHDNNVNNEIYDLFKTKYFKVYIQKDVIGAAVGAAYKNVVAIASGIMTGLGYKINTKAALLTKGLAEMAVFNKAMKGKEKTILGLTGLGDLIVTATSDLSRNFTYGKNLAQGKNKKASNATVEGLTAIEFINKIGIQKKLDLPIVYSLNRIIFKGKKIESEIKNLWQNNKVFE